MALVSSILVTVRFVPVTNLFFLTPAADYVKNSQEIIEILTPRPVWPPDSELNGRESILVGYITSGDTTRRIINHGSSLLESQLAYYNDGALSLAIEEINNSTTILPNHMVRNPPPPPPES